MSRKIINSVSQKLNDELNIPSDPDTDIYVSSSDLSLSTEFSTFCTLYRTHFQKVSFVLPTVTSIPEFIKVLSFETFLVRPSDHDNSQSRYSLQLWSDPHKIQLGTGIRVRKVNYFCTNLLFSTGRTLSTRFQNYLQIPNLFSNFDFILLRSRSHYNKQYHIESLVPYQNISFEFSKIL